MKQKLKFALILLVILYGCGSSKFAFEENLLPESNFRGKVRTVKTTTYSADIENGKVTKGKKADTQSRPETVMLYDQEGNLLEERQYDSDGTLVNKWVYEYNDKGKETGRAYYFYGDLVEKEVNKYDEAGNLTEQYAYDYNDSLKYKREIRYDEKGNVKEIEADRDLFWGRRNIYTYNEEENTVAERTFYEDSTFNFRTIYRFDKKNNLVGLETYDSEGTLQDSTIYTYDKMGNEVQARTYSPQGKRINQTTNKYEYDRKKNWIRKIEYEDGEAKYIVEREIEYF
ncbi:hypothetical protein ACFSRY_01725 [Pontibacter locisalis]|uniref:YD repeat-containing protein n=1 Tax=Pontibacter locisalis TaxID=1719035 RepID=A0ABW5IG54_9BACT